MFWLFRSVAQVSLEKLRTCSVSHCFQVFSCAASQVQQSEGVNTCSCLLLLLCCCRCSKDPGRGGSVHVGGKPGQHQLWGGGSPRSLGGLVQRRPPAALRQHHQREDLQHANHQLPGGLLHLTDAQTHQHVWIGRLPKWHMWLLEDTSVRQSRTSSSRG